MKHFRILFILLGVLFSQAIAKSAPTFCKCTCFKNSTIVGLGPSDASDKTPSHVKPSGPRSLNLDHPFTTEGDDDDDDHPSPLSARAASASCAQCTRAFCLNYGFPFCKNAEEKDVVTMCFQRDSRKDQIIVWGFIFGTLGLLGWAGVKKLVEMRENKKMAAGGIGLPGGGGTGLGNQNRGIYAPVDGR